MHKLKLSRSDYLVKIFHSPHCFYMKSIIHLNLCSSVHNTVPTITSAENNSLATAYTPSEIENNFRSSDYFEPVINDNLKPFSIILPPPNVTGALHLGHALTLTIQDILVKWHRMQGCDTRWLSGIDHAGIATQVVVEKKLWKERQITRHHIGREKFIEEIMKWKRKKAELICSQFKIMNTSLENLNENVAFTMDPQHVRSVNEAFVRLFDAGLIYRAKRLVNWSCRLQSAISDLEVDRREVPPDGMLTVPGYDKQILFGRLYKFAYKLENSSGDELVVATTRPETMPGDVAVAVHPADCRYNQHIGKFVKHPLGGARLPVVADEFVDPNFGTGVVKITPSHDPVDFEVAQRQGLPLRTVIDSAGKIAAQSDQLYADKPRFEARRLIVDGIAERRLLRGSDAHALSVPICSRSGDVVEYLPREQWYVRCSDMAQRALDAVRSGKLKLEPSGVFEKTWINWLENAKDWCVSRQLWWGHQIPAFVCTTKSVDIRTCWVAALTEEDAHVRASKILGTNDIECKRDEDVLDTWFSSALLPFSRHGWPDSDPSLSKHYPLSLMETGHDILMFWVARMVMMGMQLTSKLPFDKVLLHGVICDANGRKMSKSLGNVITPEDVIYGVTLQDLEKASLQSLNEGVLSESEFKLALQGQKKMFPNGIPRCGADALRLTLASHNIKSHFINFDVDECRTNKLFGNKVWQATKFAMKWIDTVVTAPEPRTTTTALAGEVGQSELIALSAIDEWVLSRLAHMVDVVNAALAAYEFHTAALALKQFLYYEFCDVYLEACKHFLQHHETHPTEALAHCRTLAISLDTGLRALAPFMPVLSEHLHRALYPVATRAQLLLPLPLPRQQLDINEDLASRRHSWRNERLEHDIAEALQAVVCIRRLKSVFNVTAKHKAPVSIVTDDTLFATHRQLIATLAHCHSLEIIPSATSLGAHGTKSPTASEQEADGNCSIVSDNLLGGRASVRLHLTTAAAGADVTAALPNNVDVGKLVKQEAKVAAELARMRGMIVHENYLRNVAETTHRNNLKKITVLEDKLARINFMKQFAENKRF